MSSRKIIKNSLPTKMTTKTARFVSERLKIELIQSVVKEDISFISPALRRYSRPIKFVIFVNNPLILLLTYNNR